MWTIALGGSAQLLADVLPAGPVLLGGAAALVIMALVGVAIIVLIARAIARRRR